MIASNRSRGDDTMKEKIFKKKQNDKEESGLNSLLNVSFMADMKRINEDVAAADASTVEVKRSEKPSMNSFQILIVKVWVRHQILITLLVRMQLD